MANQKSETTIGVISDTHLPDSGPLPLTLLKSLEEVEVIIHLGDFCTIETYKDLQKDRSLSSPYTAIWTIPS